MTGTPYPPDETADDLRAVLRRNHPDLTDADLDRLLTGEPKKRRPSFHTGSHWYDNKGRRTGGGAVRRGRGSSTPVAKRMRPRRQPPEASP